MSSSLWFDDAELRGWQTYSFSVPPGDAPSVKIAGQSGLSQAFDLMVTADRPSLSDTETTYYVS